jgi:hypothetical protein
VEVEALASFGSKAVEVTADVPELGRVVFQLALCSKHPCLALRLR